MEKARRLYMMVVIMIVCCAMVLSACGNGNNAAPSASNTPTPTPEASNGSSSGNAGNEASGEPTQDINWAERKAMNEAAGEITYMTGYYYAASPPDIQVVMADELGYFEELGLKVKIMPGLDSEGMKFLAAGQAQIASAGTPSLVIQSVANGADISGIATFGGVGTSALLVMSDSGIAEPKDLVGKTIGYHGAMPANILAMFDHNGVDPTSVKGVSVGYDPTVLSTGKVDALTVYKSNEPYQLEQMGESVSIIDPGQFGAETSFGVLAANNKFAAEHPTAVEDFLRAVSKAHEYAVANPDESLQVLAARSDSVYDIPAETNRWAVERELVESSRAEGHGVAWQTDEQWQREIDMLFAASVIGEQLEVSKVMNNAFIDSIYDGEQLIWLEQ
ncbi:nitrate ABC transporter substrate-binding protein [Paenibacillus montaniterrae]|uniref:Thiamine pyrimidine synthase n=1 Tax=Paenibacillus montaniterrae TaxID=429341 RepID=A0A919YQ22_9BACL|nr:ABC transporter substrate-binding protein [Paenibacillus montaniterrae]GIP17580.1 nitrate ABC transporter substrate-binding protein [Paenibacillus montaniterrae]